MAKNIGECIQYYRKKKGASQAEMADWLGVSAQAISKWEHGGAPDTLLLPKIADYLGVSVDALFDRQGGSPVTITDGMNRFLESLDEKNQIHKACEIAWQASRTIMNIPEYGELVMNPNTSVSDLQYNRDCFSSNYGLVYGYINEKCPNVLLMEEPEEGFGALFEPTEKLCQFFSSLSDVQFMNVIMFIYSRESLPFSLDYIASKLKMNWEKAREVLGKLRTLNLVEEAKIETEDGIMYVYQPKLKECFIPFMFYGSEMLRKISMWSMLYSTRTEPLL